jgi:hypothetical protein
MVAYNFQRRFVEPIRVGLSKIQLSFDYAKRQTIRAPRGGSGHAKPGDFLQLYCGMRTKNCFLIGRAVCTETKFIRLDFSYPGLIVLDRNDLVLDLNEFARRDGFIDFNFMRDFWRKQNPQVFATGADIFEGILILWEPHP